MTKYSSTAKYYLLLVFYSISVGLLLLSAFVGFKCLNSESWVLSNEYLVWILGFGIGGLVLFGGTLIVSTRWRQSNLIVRPQMPWDQYKFLIVAIVGGIFLITSQLTSILTVGSSLGTLGLFVFLPFMLLLWLFSATKFAVKFKDGAKIAGLPFFVSSIVICLVVLLSWTNSSTKFGFRWRLGGYEDVVRLVERGELKTRAGGFTTLPVDYQWLSDSGEIIIIHRENLTSVIFFTQLGFPGEYYAIAYRSDDTVPENFRDDRCDRGWRVQANIPNWFVCISTKL
jgi:hypothetical protein